VLHRLFCGQLTLLLRIVNGHDDEGECDDDDSYCRW
jgi:hypothetical protein